MVQNWENFMSPSGGAYDVNYATGGGSILAGIAVDFFAIRQIGLFSKISNKDITGLKRRHLNTTTISDFIEESVDDGATKYKTVTRQGSWRSALKTRNVSTTFTPLGEPFRLSGFRSPGESLKEFQKDFNKYKGQVTNRLSKRYGGTKNLLRGVSWSLLVSGGMMLAEGLTTPGTVSREAMMADQRALGPMGPMDSDQAYTQRQRALMAIHDSQLGIRNVIGNEAGHLHR